MAIMTMTRNGRGSEAGRRCPWRIARPFALAMATSLFVGWGCSPAGGPAKGAAAAAAGPHAGGAVPCTAAAAGKPDAHGHATAGGFAVPANFTAPAGKEAPAEAEAASPGENLSPAAIEAQSCGHTPRTIDCDECRYEVGVVKLRQDVAGALIKTAKLPERELIQRLRLTGEVAFDATAMVEVVPMAPGNVIAVKARLGQEVRAGDVLAVIHSSEVGETKATYLEVLTAAEIATQERDRQRVINAALMRLLAPLPQGQTTMKMNGEPLGEWKSKLIGAAARLDQARAVFDREKALVAKNASSQAELETAQRELQTAEADYAALTEEAQLRLKLDLLRAENTAKQAEANLSAITQRLYLFGLDDAAIAQWRDLKDSSRFADLEVKAPRAGTITALSMTTGRSVDVTQSLCTIADLSNLWVWCDLYERDLAQLHEFMGRQGKPEATVKVAAFADTFAGVVDLVGSQLDETTRTVKVRVQVPQPQGKLRPGMFATVEIALPTGRKVTMVPKSAVLADAGRQFVFQYWRDDFWLQRHVVLGATDGDQVEIVSGVAPGALVVVGGGFMLKSDVLRAKMGAGCAD